MEALNTFNFNILKSPLFKLTLGDKKQSAENDDNTAFFVQRELLASVSPEMRKHIENGMKEALNGEMVLHDVDEDTLQRFLQWAYMKDYETSQSTNPALLLHAKLYVFADRFNIGSLKDLSFGKLTSILNEHANPDHSFSADVFTAAKYAIENLPALTERLVDHLLNYIAQILDNVCDLPEFEELALAHPHAAVALVRLARAEKPPLIKGSATIPLSGVITPLGDVVGSPSTSLPAAAAFASAFASTDPNWRRQGAIMCNPDSPPAASLLRDQLGRYAAYPRRH